MSDRQKKYNIPLHLLLVFVLLVIGIVTSGYLLYATQKAELKKRDNNDLSAIAALKVREIDSWRKERLEDAHVIQQNLPAIHRIRQLLENPSSDEIRQELLPWIKSLRESYQCGSVVLFDTNKEVRLYWGDETKLVGSNAAALVEEAMQTKQIIFSDIYWGQVKHVIRLDISVPLFIREGHEDVPVGVLLLRIDPHRNLYPMIQFWPTSSPTAETLVVRREGDEVVFLNELRHKKDTPLSFRMPISEKQSPAAMAARGEEGIVEGMDYRSVPVLAAIKAVPDTPWYVIAKIDSDEVYATVHELFWMMFIVVCALIISAGTATALVWRHQRARFYRKQYEAELEHEALTKHYEFLTKYANDIILMVDGGWKIVEANERAVQAYGHSYDELLQMNIREVYDPEVIPFLPGWIDQVDKGNGLVYETVHSRKDGTIFPVEISARAITVEGKKFYQAIIRDITARKRSVEALQISEARYRRLFESARDGILIIDADTGQIIDANAFMQDLLGYSCEEFVGKRLWDIGPFKDIAASKSSFDELQRKGYIHYENLPVETSDGGRINVEFISYVYMVDGKNVIQCNIRDITDRKRAEEALRESEELYKTLAEKSMAGVYVVQDGNFRFINSNAASYTGYTREELLDQEAVLIVSPEDRERVRQNAKAMLLGEMSSPYEFRIITKQGETRWIMETVTSILHEGRRAILGNSMNITERKRAEEEARKYSAELIEKNEELRAMTQQLWQAAKLATMGELSASIAHELNNPLATVSLRIGSLQERMVADNHDRRDLEIIAQEVERMGNLVANLLQFSRRSRPQISTVDLCEEIEKTLELIHYHLRKNNISIMRQFASDVPRIHADRQQLRQLFLNLFTNASDSMPRGGTLTIRMTAPPESMQVIIEVADTGTGIPPEILPKAGEPFYTTKPVGEGTGLGLAICRRVVQEHNGTFDLTSEGIPGRGTTARISLPVTHGTISASLKNQ